MKKIFNLNKRKLLKSGVLILFSTILIPANLAIAKEYNLLPYEEIKYIIKALRNIQKIVCLKEADRLVKNYNQSKFYNLHLRNAEIDIYDAELIAFSLKKTHQNNQIILKSFSISYNPTVKLYGLKFILDSLPDHIQSLGLVACNFDDDAGEIIMSFLSRSKNLKMVCIEDNNFSNSMKKNIKNSVQHLNGCTIIV